MPFQSLSQVASYPPRGCREGYWCAGVWGSHPQDAMWHSRITAGDTRAVPISMPKCRAVRQSFFKSESQISMTLADDQESTKSAGMRQSWRHSLEITPLWINHTFDKDTWVYERTFSSPKNGVPTHIFLPVVGRTKAITAGLPHQLGHPTRYSSSNLAMLTGATFGVAVQMLWIVVAGRVRGFNPNPLFLVA